MTVTGFSELTLRAQDMEGLARFYRRAFRLTELSREDDRIWLAVGRRSRLGIWTPGKKEFGDQGGAHVHFAFTAQCDSLDEIARRIRAEGITVKGPVQHPGGDRSIYAEDPEGNLVEAWDLFDGGATVRRLIRADEDRASQRQAA